MKLHLTQRVQISNKLEQCNTNRSFSAFAQYHQFLCIHNCNEITFELSFQVPHSVTAKGEASESPCPNDKTLANYLKEIDRSGGGEISSKVAKTNQISRTGRDIKMFGINSYHLGTIQILCDTFGGSTMCHRYFLLIKT